MRTPATRGKKAATDPPDRQPGDTRRLPVPTVTKLVRPLHVYGNVNFTSTVSISPIIQRPSLKQSSCCRIWKQGKNNRKSAQKRRWKIKWSEKKGGDNGGKRKETKWKRKKNLWKEVLGIEFLWLGNTSQDSEKRGNFKWTEVGDLFEILINSVKYPLENSPRSVNMGGKKESRSESGRLKRGRKGREEDKGGREEDKEGR